MNRVLALVDVFSECGRTESLTHLLSRLYGLKVIYEMTSELDILSIVSESDTRLFGDALGNGIMKTYGARGTRPKVLSWFGSPSGNSGSIVQLARGGW